jgi:hypothetical protein
MGIVKKDKEVQQQAAEVVRDKFDLRNFKKRKGFTSESVRYKPLKWIPLSKAFQSVTSIPGIPMGHITMLRGHSDTGKTTTLLETAASCQRMGILPVFIITEMKWTWDFARSMGVQFEEVVDKETGEITGYDGFFLYVDRSTLGTIEDVASYIADLLDEQAKGKLPYNLCFLWDSMGSIPCRMSVESKSNSNMWNAGAMSLQFGGFIDQKIILSRKESSPYTNTLVLVSKIWVSPPESPMGSPKVNSKGGEALYYDSSLCILFGNIANSGVTKLKAVAGGKEFEWGKRTSIQVEKNHIGGVTSRGKIIMTPTGFIVADDKEIEKYKTDHKQEWVDYLGSADFKMVEEEEDTDSGLFIPGKGD